MTNLRNNITAGTSIKIAAAVAACLAFSACGAIAEKITEEGAERIIEAETGEDVELDFDNGDGSFSVQTEDGSFSLNEDGDFVVTGEDGEVFTGSADDDGLVVLDEDGNSVVDVSGDGETGEITMQGEDGESVFRMVTEIPAEWPSEVPRPEGLTIESGSFVSADGETVMTVLGVPGGDGAIRYVEAYTAALESSSMIETGRFDSASDGTETAQRTFETETWTLNINGFDDDESGVVNISLFSK